MLQVSDDKEFARRMARKNDTEPVDVDQTAPAEAVPGVGLTLLPGK
jgi:hypothetical protein